MARKLAKQLTLALCLAINFAILLTLLSVARAGEINVDSDSVAIKGFDAVAYFTMSDAVPGSRNFAHTWLGAKWQFANEKHRDLFASNPISYAPQYGGYCAFGVSFGRRGADIDPKVWQIIDGKLYLNYGPENKGSAKELIARADANWEKHKKYFTGD